MLRIHRFTIAAAAIALCASWPATSHGLITPDAIDAGNSQRPTQSQNLRSPDAAEPFQTTVDKRSPDVRFGQPNGEQAPAVAIAPTRVRIVEVPSSGFQWGDAGVGAASMLALVLIGVGVTMAGVHRHGRRLTATTR